MQVQNHASVDLYIDQVLRHAKVILLSLHGGVGYWRYGVEQLVELSTRGVQLIPVPGDDRPDPELTQLGTVTGDQAERLWHYLRQGGKANAANLFNCLASLWLGRDYAWEEPQPLPRTTVYHPAKPSAVLQDWYCEWQPDWPVAPSCSIARTCKRPTQRSSILSASACRQQGSIRCLSPWPASRRRPAWTSRDLAG